MNDRVERVVEWVREREPHPVYIPEHMRGTVREVKGAGDE